jgi:hypothetical protein
VLQFLAHITQMVMSFLELLLVFMQDFGHEDHSAVLSYQICASPAQALGTSRDEEPVLFICTVRPFR